MLLGIRSIRERKHLAGALTAGAIAPRSLGRTIREGFIVGFTNPKGVLIFTAVLPQFIDRSEGHYTLAASVTRTRVRADRAAVRQHLGAGVGDARGPGSGARPNGWSA